MRQDELAGWLQASIAPRIGRRTQAPSRPIVQVPVKRLDGLGVAQIDAALPAAFRDRGTQADFDAHRTPAGA